MFQVKWDVPPRSSDEAFMWKVYCRIWNDVGLTAPGSIIYQWYKRESIMSFDEHALFMDAVIHYIHHCNE